MSKRFDYIKYDEETVAVQEKFKALFVQIDDLIEQEIIPIHARTFMRMHLEEAYMWSGKALRDQQLAKVHVDAEGKVHIPERG